MKFGLLFVFIFLGTSFSDTVSLGFGSCLFQGKPMPILSAVKRYEPALFVFLGDNVYGDFKSKQWPLWRAYRRQRMNLDAIGWNIPSLYIWDDGDLGENDGGSNFLQIGRSRELFFSAWDVGEDDPRRGQNSLYYEKVLRSNNMVIQILLLDVRSQRSAWRRNPERQLLKRYLKDASQEKTMLGYEQWSLFQESIKRQVDLRILVSPIQVLAIGHHWECWDLFPNERKKLLHLLDSGTSKATLIVSGDRHRAAFYQVKMPESKTLFLEVTTSSLNSKAENRSEPGPNRLTDLYCDENFALLEVSKDLIQIGLYDLFGKVIGQQRTLIISE